MGSTSRFSNHHLITKEGSSVMQSVLVLKFTNMCNEPQFQIMGQFSSLVSAKEYLILLSTDWGQGDLIHFQSDTLCIECGTYQIVSVDLDKIPVDPKPDLYDYDPAVG
jgi:hypothetical protein